MNIGNVSSQQWSNAGLYSAMRVSVPAAEAAYRAEAARPLAQALFQRQRTEKAWHFGPLTIRYESAAPSPAAGAARELSLLAASLRARETTSGNGSDAPGSVLTEQAAPMPAVDVRGRLYGASRTDVLPEARPENQTRQFVAAAGQTAFAGTSFSRIPGWASDSGADSAPYGVSGKTRRALRAYRDAAANFVSRSASSLHSVVV